MTKQILTGLVASSQQTPEKLNLSANSIHDIESDALSQIGTKILKVMRIKGALFTLACDTRLA